MSDLFTLKAEGLKEAIGKLEGAPKSIRWAFVIGATRTVKQMAAELKAEMPKAFDRPTPFAIRSIGWKGATINNPVAKVGFGLNAFDRSARTDWARPEVHGGKRNTKAFESKISALVGGGPWYVVPGRGARLDRYGNLSAGMIQQVLSDLGIQSDAAQNATAKSKTRNRRARYFLLKRGGAPIGIAVRTGKRKMELALLLTKKQPTYEAAYQLMEVSRKVADEVFPAEVRKAFRL